MLDLSKEIIKNQQNGQAFEIQNYLQNKFLNENLKNI
jgi:hypothetical protein